MTMGSPPLRVVVGGAAIVNLEASNQIKHDLVKAESIALLLTLLLLVLAFRGLIAAVLPLIIGVVAIVGTLLLLRGLASVTSVSVYALNLTTALGLGLGIDYSLLLVSRFREELAAGLPTQAAVVETVRTAGRTVLFSAATVAVSLLALLLFPEYFLSSFGYAGIAVVALAAIAAAAGGHRQFRVRPPAARPRRDGAGDLPRPVPDDREPDHPGQGPDTERGVTERDLRRRCLGLPAGSPVRRAGLHAERLPGRQHVAADVLPGLRAVHGLPGVPAQPHPGGIRPVR